MHKIPIAGTQSARATLAAIKEERHVPDIRRIPIDENITFHPQPILNMGIKNVVLDLPLNLPDDTVEAEGKSQGYYSDYQRANLKPVHTKEQEAMTDDLFGQGFTFMQDKEVATDEQEIEQVFCPCLTSK